jgi:hypothetical protein
MTDVSSLIESATWEIAPFSIAFARLSFHDGEEDVALAGSGALVTVGSIHGILTAAHVLEALPNDGEVGLIRFTRNKMVQSQTIDLSLTDRLLIGGQSNGARGPDIGFLRLNHHQVGTLNATNVFYNLTMRQQSVLSNDHPTSECFEAVSGLIEEWTINHPKDEAGRTQLKGFRGLFGVVAHSVGSREAAGYDLVEYEAIAQHESPAPFSYQGWSGAALWRIYITRDDNGELAIAKKRIVGLAFYQSDAVDDARLITCHGPIGLYGNFLEQVQRKWPEP